MCNLKSIPLPRFVDMPKKIKLVALGIFHILLLAKQGGNNLCGFN